MIFANGPSAAEEKATARSVLLALAAARRGMLLLDPNGREQSSRMALSYAHDAEGAFRESIERLGVIEPGEQP